MTSATEGRRGNRKYHFIAGLPRSGSTLLAAILQQNPRFHAGMTGPVGTLFENMIGQFSASTEIAPMLDDGARQRLLKGLFDSYYSTLPEARDLVFDTNRAWTTMADDLATLFPDYRVIACVRDVPWVMDSLERQYRSNNFEHTGLFANWAERSSVYSRCETLARADRPVGFSLRALREMCFGSQAHRLLIVDYAFLVTRPKAVLDLIYKFIDEPVFTHDFDNLSYQAEAFDSRLGLKELHTIRPKVEIEDRRTILPPDLFERYGNDNFWRNLKGSAASVITSAAPAAAAGDAGPSESAAPAPENPAA